MAPRPHTAQPQRASTALTSAAAQPLRGSSNTKPGPREGKRLFLAYSAILNYAYSYAIVDSVSAGVGAPSDAVGGVPNAAPAQILTSLPPEMTSPLMCGHAARARASIAGSFALPGRRNSFEWGSKLGTTGHPAEWIKSP